jgi:hypothetical protein
MARSSSLKPYASPRHIAVMIVTGLDLIQISKLSEPNRARGQIKKGPDRAQTRNPLTRLG